MANSNLIVQKKETNKLKNLGVKIATYRQCANIPFNIFAERCGVGVEVLDAVEKGIYSGLTVQQVLRFAEELGVSYYDLYEGDNDRYYTSVHDDAAFRFIFRKVNEYGAAELARKLDLNINNLYSYRHITYVPSPFVLSNILALLNINSATLRNAVQSEERAQKAAEEIEAAAMPTEPEAPNVDALNEVIKAVNVYKNVDTLKAELNEIISKAQNLINLLGA